jgi:hypothetical protein
MYRIRGIGAGRPNIYNTYPKLDQAFTRLIEKHTAGDPMNSSIKWTYLSQSETVKKFGDLKIYVSKL